MFFWPFILKFPFCFSAYDNESRATLLALLKLPFTNDPPNNNRESIGDKRITFDGERVSPTALSTRDTCLEVRRERIIGP